jgi:hypothetical protein
MVLVVLYAIFMSMSLNMLVTSFDFMSEMCELDQFVLFLCILFFFLAEMACCVVLVYFLI